MPSSVLCRARRDQCGKCTMRLREKSYDGCIMAISMRVVTDQASNPNPTLHPCPLAGHHQRGGCDGCDGLSVHAPSTTCWPSTATACVQARGRRTSASSARSGTCSRWVGGWVGGCPHDDEMPLTTTTAQWLLLPHTALTAPLVVPAALAWPSARQHCVLYCMHGCLQCYPG